MSETKYLKLHKHDEPLESNENEFDIDKALNQNWNKVDENVEQLNTDINSLQEENIKSKEEITNIKEEQETQNANIEENGNKIAELQKENVEIKEENNRLKEGLNALPTVKANGESIILESTAKAKLRKIRIEGNSSRENEVIRNVSGNIEIDICNKNLLSNKIEDYDISNGLYGYRKIVGELRKEYLILTITDRDTSININEVYFGFTGNGKNSDEEKAWIVQKGSILGILVGNKRYISTRNFKYFSFYPNNKETFNKIFNRFNIEVELSDKSSPLDFITHESKNLVFPLTQDQKLMQGDYLADDGIHHKRKQTILDGTENWNKWDFESEEYIGFILDNEINYNNTIGIDVRAISNCFTVKSETSMTEENISLRQSGDGLNRVYICIKKNRLPSQNVSGFKTWLRTQKETEIPVILEYELAEEIVETYTEEQQEAYNQIQTAISYKGQTNIFSMNETKPIFEVEALADIGILLNNMQAQILVGGE